MRTHISLPRLFQLSLKYRSTSFQGSMSDSRDARGQLKWSWTKTSGQLKNCHVIATLDKRWCGWKKSVSWHQGVVQWGFKNTRKGSVTEKSAWGNHHLFCLQSFAYGSAFSLLIYHSAPLRISLVLLPIHYPIVWVFFFLSLCPYNPLPEFPITGCDQMVLTMWFCNAKFHNEFLFPHHFKHINSEVEASKQP